MAKICHRFFTQVACQLPGYLENQLNQHCTVSLSGILSFSHEAVLVELLF